MRPTTVIAIVAIFTVLVAVVLAVLARHKKAGSGDVKLIGEIATVDTKLDPEGTVIVCGELWRARSHDGGAISSRARVRVVGFKDHLALVEACD
jgi:membrane-bound ClpP family serine protease